MSAHTTCSAAKSYDVTFKIVSIELKDSSETDDLSVCLRFAEKSLTIKPGDENTENGAINKQIERDSAVNNETSATSKQRKSEKPSERKSRKSVVNDVVSGEIRREDLECDDEPSHCDSAVNKETSSKQRKSRKSVVNDEDFECDEKPSHCPADDEDETSSKGRESTDRARSLSSRRQASLAATAAKAKSTSCEKSQKQCEPSQGKQREFPQEKRREPSQAKPPTSAQGKQSTSAGSKVPIKTGNSTNNSSSFGSITTRFEDSPVCISEKLGRHCIKYEVCRGCDLIGELFPRNFSRTSVII
jgi:hypothetical protein